METFYPPVFSDSVFSSNDPIKNPEFLDEFFQNFDQLYTNSRNHPLNHQEGSSLISISNEQEQSTSNIITPFVTEKQRSTESFTSMAENEESENKLTPKLVNLGKKRKKNHGSPSNSTLYKEEDKQVKKSKKQKGSKEGKKEEGSEEASKGYIHVRARRGQATDTHSLAERARREKISEKMKTLQALVPGCDKVTGKAPMLDEIINYVQSLQNQVELLSMKLASLDPMLYIFGLMDHHAIPFRAEDATSSQHWGLDDLHQNTIINQFGFRGTNNNDNNTDMYFVHD